MSMRKAMVTIGAEPEERQPLACILLGSLSGVHEYTVAMVDTGCTAYQVATQEVMRYLLKNHPECVVFVKEHEEPIEIDTCSKEGGTRVTHQTGIRYRYISTTGQPSEEYIYETDVIEGGSTGDCTVLQGNTLCEDLSMKICFQKGGSHYFTIEPEKDRRFPLSFSHAQLKGVIAKARNWAIEPRGAGKGVHMGGKERPSLVLRRVNNPALPHNPKGLVGLGRSASEIIRATSI